ncbi:hypothetical protein CEV31_3191 [Brucella thiophenivorans]|uniref:Uncharacterized protein n=1 Tax=Brucella thiophenivorans TaxID=571255 RepID=A0A256FJR9_9HYPH|nr:hypothetical protein CEV31_3191 [Brucella thiophenivorans]
MLAICTQRCLRELPASIFSHDASLSAYRGDIFFKIIA